MRIKHLYLILIPTVFILVIFVSCKKTPALQAEYLSLIEEIHNIECEHLNKAGINITDTAVYAFRGEAFQQILKNTDRKVLAHYEDLCARVATIVDNMNEIQKYAYEKDVMLEYSKKCK
jgi:sulfur transfer complex TusBCD TusB component (DsrH family)